MKKLDRVMLAVFFSGIAMFGGVALFAHEYPEFAPGAGAEGIIQKIECGILGLATFMTLVAAPYYSIHREFFIGKEEAEAAIE